MLDPNQEPPIDPLDDTNPSKSQEMRAVNLNAEPPISPDDTNPSKSQEMRAIRLDEEPPINPDDTAPSLIRPPAGLREALIDPQAEPAPNPLARVFGILSLLAAAGFTVAAVFLFMQPTPQTPAPTPETTPALSALSTEVPTDTASATPTDTAANTPDPAPPVNVGAPQLAPTLSAEQANALLQQPLQAVAPSSSLVVVRNAYAPFTLIPDRPRGEVVNYVIERGDTINGIAEKFGIRPESVVWANDRNIVGQLIPGRTLNIVPTDGVYIARHTGNSTIADYASQYRLADPYEIIDSEFNPQLRGLSPETVPPSGVPIFIPNGEAEQINWNPTVVREGGGADGSGGGGGANFITFAPGDPGSCGRVENPGGGAFWTNPMSNYTWMRGFTSFHTGVDLAASEGTPVRAANSGRVIFAGWNSWGYGYTVVLAHGPFTTVYGHLSSIYVSCGQDVGAGATIAGTGNTGNSTGPHLHFEIRYNDQPQDPTISIAF